ncbi:nicotinamide riboside kinase 1 isoform X1 [Ahaetulla prasina]|uniref:nicotinamide riboside kinase 1 isoform X1 n=1 Tax=Ahaetulla prasina TaxID=499056 RepID=UPI0026489058|nr:nicotinamide riboside kinase 1 isoform X1 [Ahaetulla prasina]XP_058029135.1 nicotinamide riboside kinase 1 isoform X1 [Ahaetulla prasina]XP_058029136.1 nicotinamide riboside kinase 1 isoform X1 [Ahaetulla prasina]XP_058029137.1 nicotinamide riboside kinase 1 isoform X1 [Ahaetulla prasina]XP_058029138.1 nicotinamide riboside kinase 1 isoform X1 [Ahaetulla prasina]
MKTLVIGLGGVTNGGKTTLAGKLKKLLPNCTIISQDDFFKPESEVAKDDRGFLQYDESQHLFYIAATKTECSIPSVALQRHYKMALTLHVILILSLCLCSPELCWLFLAAAAHCWLISKWLSTRTPRSLSQVLLLSKVPHIRYLCILLLPKCRTLLFSLLNFILLDSAQCSSLSRSFCNLSLSSGVLAIPASLVSSANLMSSPFIPLSKSLMKMLKSTGPKTEPWGTPLHTSLHVDVVPLRTTR